MVEIIFVLFISIGGSPLTEVGRYPSAAECIAALGPGEAMSKQAGSTEWTPTEISASCVALVVPPPPLGAN